MLGDRVLSSQVPITTKLNAYLSEYRVCEGLVSESILLMRKI